LNGVEWLIEAFGCSKQLLQSQTELANLFESIVSEMCLRPVGTAVWHQFPGTAGITGVWLLQESHLAIHTFPEFSSACLNLFCCSRRSSLDWNGRLTALLGATTIQVQECARNYASGTHSKSILGR
jgi:S-adenosylmethionine decarboxylase